MIRVAVALALVIFACPMAARAQPVITATPAEVLEGEPLDVIVSNLAPGEEVVVRASRVAPVFPVGQRVFRSHARFKADAQGRIDLSSQPMAGSSWDRPDRAGLFWSMVADPRTGPAPGQTTDPGLLEADSLSSGRVVLEVDVEGGMAARSEVLIRPAAADVTTTEIREPGVTGVFARNDDPQIQRAVIVLGGSEGGLLTARSLAPLLASRGYAVLGVGYFQGGEPQLSALKPNLELIPLEILEAARDWLSRQPGVDASGVAVVGVSKGAELALLAAATFDWVVFAGAFAPSHVIWEGIPPDDNRWRDAGSSWTYRGEPLPFVRWSQEAERRGDEARATTGVSRLVEVHLESMVEYAEDIDRARLPVERSRAALFIAAGSDDGMWPSAYAAEQIRLRLSTRTPAADFQVVIVPTGHQIMATGWSPTPIFNRPTGRLQGGNARLDAEAQAVLWPRFVQFLDRQMGPRDH